MKAWLPTAEKERAERNATQDLNCSKDGRRKMARTLKYGEDILVTRRLFFLFLCNAQ